MRVHGVSLVSLSPYATTADHDGLSFAPGPFGSVSRRTFVAPRVFLFFFSFFFFSFNLPKSFVANFDRVEFERTWFLRVCTHGGGVEQCGVEVIGKFWNLKNLCFILELWPFDIFEVMKNCGINFLGLKRGFEKGWIMYIYWNEETFGIILRSE